MIIKRCVMKMLIIFTYPNHNSLNYAFLQKVIKGSNENPKIKEIQVLDLYEEGFNPLLVFNEQNRRRDMHTDTSIEKYRKQIRWADKIVFIYPIWWGRPPQCLWDILINYLPPILPIKISRGFSQKGF